MSKPNFSSIVLLLLCLAVATPAAQSNYATLSGTVFDPQRQAVPGAVVRATSVTTRAVRQATTNGDGAFQLTGLLPGEYELTVEAGGFAALTRAVNVEVGQQLTLDIDLKVSDVSTTVEVKGVEAVLRTTDASVGEVVEPQLFATSRLTDAC